MGTIYIVTRGNKQYAFEKVGIKRKKRISSKKARRKYGVVLPKSIHNLKFPKGEW